MRVVRTVAELRTAIAERRAQGDTVGFAPTMGYLHEGHLSLFDVAGQACDHVVASIFVNPLQFGEGEDLATYPTDLAGDLEKAQARGVDLMFTPSVEEMYPGGGPVITVDPGPMADRLCGRSRPGHFRGVLTVVAKLLHLVEPELAVFGSKDFQQGALIGRMTRDLNMAVRIVLAPIVREPDGLAMSSRNAYLGAEDRKQALGLSAALGAASAAFAGGLSATDALGAMVRDKTDEFPGLEVQYAQFVDPDTLDDVALATPKTVLALAAFCGGTRIIDNRRLGQIDA